MNTDGSVWALSPTGEVLKFNYWYSANNYDDAKKLARDLQDRGYVLHLDYHDTVLTSFKVVGIKKPATA